MNSFEELGEAFSERIAELRRLSLLRLQDSAKGLFQQDLVGLEASVRALECQVATLKTCIQGELSAMPKVEALIAASRLQSGHLDAIASNLPARLPRPVAPAVSYASGRPVLPGAGQPEVPQTAGHSGAIPAGGEDAIRRRKDVPRWYVTESEFEATSSYLRGRLQPDKVNAALDELASHALDNHKLMAAVKGGGGKLPPAERKRATDLMHSVALKDGIKGHYWFLDSDLRDGVVVKLDKTGKSMLTLLRHLGRLQEVRCNVDGVGMNVYVLVEEPRRHG